MKVVIIYVFGPKRIKNYYFQEKPHNISQELDYTKWIKLGLTTDNNIDSIQTLDIKKIKDEAYSRISQETRTGISEVCELFDVFVYPEMKGKIDDKIRGYMTDDIYILHNSKSQNSGVDKSNYEIKAGREFVYNATQAHVYNAIAKFERDTIATWDNAKTQQDILECIQFNYKITHMDAEVQSEAELNDLIDSEKQTINDFWKRITNKLSPYGIKTTYTEGRNYMIIKPTLNKLISQYYLTYSTRTQQVNINIYAKEDSALDVLQQNINTYASKYNIEVSEPFNGKKDKTLTIWRISKDALDEQWVIDQITQLYNYFESNI